MSDQKTPGTGGEHYVPYGERTGGESTVYFTKDLSAEGLHNIFLKVGGHLTGKVAVKLHTGKGLITLTNLNFSLFHLRSNKQHHCHKKIYTIQ